MGLLLDRIERYYDTVPRAAAVTEEIGPFTLFVSTSTWPYYARPRLGSAGPFSRADVDRVRRRQGQRAVPEAIEWVDEMTPGLLPIVRACGFAVQECPLMVLYWNELPPAPDLGDGVSLRTLTADDTAIAAATAVAAVSFGAGGVQVGRGGTAERDAAAAQISAADVDRYRARITSGRTVTVVAEDRTGILAVGSHQPVDDVTEIVGVATLPAARRRGLGAAITAALVADADARGTDIVFLSAGSEDIARIYGRVGFHRVGTACIAGRH